MTFGSSDTRNGMVAILASLQIAIEPAVLPLMVAAGTVPSWGCGLVVGAGQAGLSAGAWWAWYAVRAAQGRGRMTATIVAMVATLALAESRGLASTLALRFVLGASMGVCFAAAAADATRERPHRAIGAIVLVQQLLATMTMALLSVAATSWGATTALGMLAAVPAVMTLLSARVRTVTADVAPPAEDPRGADRRALGALALLLALVAMTWSYVAAIGAALGFDAGMVSAVLSLTSLASAPAALLAALAPPRRGPGLTAAVCVLGLLAPVALPPGSPWSAYVLALLAFNAASAFAVVRFAGWASDTSDDRARRLVVLTQCVAMAAGAPLGAAAMAWGGFTLLALFATGGAVAAVMVAVGMTPAARRYGSSADAASFARSPRTAAAPMLPLFRTAAISAAVKGAGFLPLAGGPSWRTWFRRSARL